MVSRRTLRNVPFGRDVAVAYAIVVALSLPKFVPFQPVQIPPSLSIVAYDLVEVAAPPLTPYYPIAFPVFLYVIAIGSAGIARKFRSTDSEQSPWRQTLGGVRLVVGIVSLGFGAFVGGASDGRSPFVATDLRQDRPDRPDPGFERTDRSSARRAVRVDRPFRYPHYDR